MSIEQSTSLRRVLAAISISVLAACGGGGGGGSDTAGYPLLAAYRASLVNGGSETFNVSGSCVGTYTATDKPAVAAVFEGVSGFSTNDTDTWNLANCTFTANAGVTNFYYDASYTLLGYVSSNGTYARAEGTTPLPQSARVGESGDYTTLVTYSDSTRAARTGHVSYRWAIEDAGGGQGVAVLTSTSHDASGKATGSASARYLLTTDARLLVQGMTIQSFSSGITLNLSPI